MDDRSSIWMIYHAAADAAATIGEMYLKENISEKKWSWKIVFFYWIYMFFKSSREYDSENAAVFAVNFHAELSQIEFLLLNVVDKFRF